MQQKKNLGNFDSDISISESEIETISVISKDIKTSTLIIFWQFILKGLEELSVVANQILSIEMLVIRLIHLKDMPNYETLLNSLNENNIDQSENNLVRDKDKKKNLNEDIKSQKNYKDQIRNTIQTKPDLVSLEQKKIVNDPKMETISSFEDLVKLTSRKKEAELKYDLERNINLVKFSNGKIDISFNEKLGKSFVRNLSERLNEWTGKRWVITLTKEQGMKTYREQEMIKRKEVLEKEKKTDIYKEFKNIFSDAELIEVSKKD